MSLINVTNLTFAYEGSYDNIFENVSFQIDTDWELGFTGRNGRRKTTFLNLLLGKYEYKGFILISHDRSFLDSCVDHILSINKTNIDESLFKSMLRKLDFSREQFEKNIEDFSGGQKKKVLLAESLCERTHLYIWDEPLNFIDVISHMQIEKLLIEHEPTILFVEHDSTFCENVATKIIKL